MKDTNEKYIKDMAIIKNNLNKIINVTTHTQNKLSDFEDKISKEINHINKEIVTKTSNESLAVILFELTYVILSQKMKSKMEMVTTVMAIMDRHSCNLNKKKIAEDIAELSDTHQIFTPEDKNKDKENCKEPYATTK